MFIELPSKLPQISNVDSIEKTKQRKKRILEYDDDDDDEIENMLSIKRQSTIDRV